MRTLPDTHPIGLDCDVIVGAWPQYATTDLGPRAVLTGLDAHGIERALVSSGRGAWFDDIEGNDETFAVTADHDRMIPTATINLRNALRTEQELDRAVERGIRVVRLFGALQGVPVTAPAYRHVARQAAERRLVVLTDGDIRELWQVFASHDLVVVFLDSHAYHVGDFVIAAREEPGFVASTRLLNAPDSIERVVGEVGASHLAYGSRSPLHAMGSSELRFRHARISDTDRAMIGGGWLSQRMEDAQ